MARPAILVLSLLAAPFPALAEGDFAAAMSALKEVRKNAFAPGARARVNPVVERVVALKDARALKPLAEFLTQTLSAEDRYFKDTIAVQKVGADAHQRMMEIDEELKYLEIRLRAGARDVAPQIGQLRRERVTSLRAFDRVREESDRLNRSIGNAREQRESLARACAAVIRATKKQHVAAALAGMRPVFDITDTREALLFVRVLRDCAIRDTAPHLIDVVTHPTVPAAPQRNAVSALAALRTPKGTVVLIQLWERDPKGSGVHVQHALSLAAKRHLADIKAARAWAGSLK